MVAAEDFDVLAHHGAEATDYRSAEFDVGAALRNNSLNLSRVLQSMRDRRLRGVVITGSVFECDAGIGEGDRPAFSPYGLSKGLTAQVFRYWCRRHGVRLGKFNIANPYGIFEEPRFCAYLVNAWARGEIATVKTPLYVRDNIFVDLLAEHYAAYLTTVATGTSQAVFGPIGFAEPQGAFAQRFATEIGSRLGLECELELCDQQTFEEPLLRLNSDSVPLPAGWSHSAAWDRLAGYYRGRIGA